MAQLSVAIKRFSTTAPIKKIAIVRLGGIMVKPIVRMFKTLTDAVRDGQVGANFFWK